MSAACPVCKGDGFTIDPFIYDCQAPGCNAAQERVAFEKLMQHEIDANGQNDLMAIAWVGQKYGKAAALEQAKHDAFLTKVEEIVDNGVKSPLAGPFIKPAILG